MGRYVKMEYKAVENPRGWAIHHRVVLLKENGDVLLGVHWSPYAYPNTMFNKSAQEIVAKQVAKALNEHENNHAEDSE